MLHPLDWDKAVVAGLTQDQGVCVRPIAFLTLVRHKCATGPSRLLLLLTSESSPLGLDLGQVEDPIDTLLQGPRFDPGNHLNGIRRLTRRCTNSN